jgi:hypothetical protein
MQINQQTLYTGAVSREAVEAACTAIGIDPTSVTYIEIDGSTFMALAEHSIEDTTPKGNQ